MIDIRLVAPRRPRPVAVVLGVVAAVLVVRMLRAEARLRRRQAACRAALQTRQRISVAVQLRDVTELAPAELEAVADAWRLVADYIGVEPEVLRWCDGVDLLLLGLPQVDDDPRAVWVIRQQVDALRVVWRRRHAPPAVAAVAADRLDPGLAADLARELLARCLWCPWVGWGPAPSGGEPPSGLRVRPPRSLGALLLWLVREESND